MKKAQTGDTIAPKPKPKVVKKKLVVRVGSPIDTTRVARPNRVYASGGKITPCAGCGKSIKKKKK